MEKDIREPFEVRIQKVDEVTRDYYEQLSAHLTSFKKVKSRKSIRCDSYRIGRKLVAKIALGGNSLKLYLAIPKDAEILVNGKYHARDLSNTKAYEEVPTMFSIKSQLAVRKAQEVIDFMMRHYN